MNNLRQKNDLIDAIVTKIADNDDHKRMPPSMPNDDKINPLIATPRKKLTIFPVMTSKMDFFLESGIILNPNIDIIYGEVLRQLDFHLH